MARNPVIIPPFLKVFAITKSTPKYIPTAPRYFVDILLKTRQLSKQATDFTGASLWFIKTDGYYEKTATGEVYDNQDGTISLSCEFDETPQGRLKIFIFKYVGGSFHYAESLKEADINPEE